jgi:biopolymer transport protein TolR
MAGTQLGGRGQPQSEPNVVPMIDIMLVLLIIFMVTQPLTRKAIDVQVPPEETPQTPQANPTQIVLELPEGGGYRVNSMPIPNKEELGNQLYGIYAQRIAKMLFIKAAPDRKYQDVIEAMDIARGAGVDVIGFIPKEVK